MVVVVVAVAIDDIMLMSLSGTAVQIWDVSKLKRTRTMTGHKQRVGTQVRTGLPSWASALVYC